MKNKNKKGPHQFRIKIVEWIIVFFTVYTIVGFLVVSPVIRIVLSQQLSEQLHRNVTVKGAIFNPYALSLYLSGIVIKDLDEKEALFSLDELYVNLEINSALEKGLILREIKVNGPYVNIIRYEDKRYNFSDLLEGEKEKTSPETGAVPLRFSLNNIQIRNGSVDFLDGPQKTRHKARDITLKIPMLSNLPYHIDTYVQPFFRMVFNDTPFLLEGRTKPFSDSLATIVDLDMEGLDIPHYLAYVPFKMNFSVVSGKVNAKNTVTFTQYAERTPSLTVEGDIALNNLEIIDEQGSPLIALPAVNVAITPSELISGQVFLSKVLVQSPEIRLMRNKEGNMNIPALVPPETGGTAGKVDETEKEKEENEDRTPFLVKAEEIKVTDGSFIFNDEFPEKPVRTALKHIEVRVENLSTGKDSRSGVSLSFSINDKGSFTTDGFIGIHPVFADLNLDMKDIDIIPLQPYFTEKVNILVTGGSFMTGGKVTFDLSGSGDMNATFKGKTALSEFASVDKEKANDFLKWNSLYISGIDFTYDPLRVNINEVSLSDFYSLLIINSDASLNVQGIIKDDKADAEAVLSEEKQEPVETVQKSGPAPQINIHRLTLQGGTVNFTDRHIKPDFSANLLEIGGRVSGLSSREGTVADVNLKGKLENHAPLEITGKINPLGEDLFVDLKIDFHDMDLSPLTPYSSKYVGHKIQKGKLSLDLAYLIDKKKLDAKNNVFLDQFTFGEKVESPDATKLPVRFAIALLKNGKGEISLDLPVTGNIDEPEFNIGKIVLKMVVNLLVKAATSPFKLLGALVGGGEELSYINFDYGKADISDPEKAKIDKLIKALGDRPGLNIDIEGYVDIEKDADGLRQYTFDNKLKAQKLKEMVEKGQPAVPVHEVVVGPEEYETYLEKAYKEETFPKPKNVLGLDKKLPAPEMEKLIYTYIEINDSDLRLLASERALKVKDYFLNTGQIDAGRVFLIEPESLQPEEKEHMRSSRVDFKLK